MSKKKRRDIPRFDTPIIETHCHLDYLEDAALADTLEKAADVGITDIITIAVSPENLERVRTLTRTADNIWGTQGIHPHEAESYSEGVEAEIRQGAGDPRILAIGEIGLDYYYDHADRGVQRRVFEQQLQLAVELELPVVIQASWDRKLLVELAACCRTECLAVTCPISWDSTAASSASLSR